MTKISKHAHTYYRCTYDGRRLGHTVPHGQADEAQLWLQDDRLSLVCGLHLLTEPTGVECHCIAWGKHCVSMKRYCILKSRDSHDLQICDDS